MGDARSGGGSVDPRNQNDSQEILNDLYNSEVDRLRDVYHLPSTPHVTNLTTVKLEALKNVLPIVIDKILEEKINARTKGSRKSKRRSAGSRSE